MNKFCTELLSQITEPRQADDAETDQKTHGEPDKTPDKKPDEKPDKEPVTDTEAPETGSTAPSYDTKLNHITLLPRTKAYFLFDIFLGDCDSATRTRVLRSFEEPVHLVLRRNHVYHVNSGDGRINETVQAAYTQSRDNDKSARPLFRDSHNHPIYMNGYRIEAEEWAKVKPREIGEEVEEEDEEEDEYDDDQDNVTHEEILREDNEVMEGLKRLTRDYGAATPPRDVVTAITDVNDAVRYNVGYYVD